MKFRSGPTDSPCACSSGRLLRDLIDGGELDPAVVSKLPTFDIGAATREWKRGDPLCI